MKSAFYLGALAYVAAPALGYQIESESILSALATVSEPVKITTKAIVAAPFVYHSANGIRHLVNISVGRVRKCVPNSPYEFLIFRYGMLVNALTSKACIRQVTLYLLLLLLVLFILLLFNYFFQELKL